MAQAVLFPELRRFVPISRVAELRGPGARAWEAGEEPHLIIQVSDRVHGTRGFREWLVDYHGKSIRSPQRPDFYPEPRFVQWHVREVFQGEARYGG